MASSAVPYLVLAVLAEDENHGYGIFARRPVETRRSVVPQAPGAGSPRVRSVPRQTYADGVHDPGHAARPSHPPARKANVAGSVGPPSREPEHRFVTATVCVRPGFRLTPDPGRAPRPYSEGGALLVVRGCAPRGLVTSGAPTPRTAPDRASSQWPADTLYHRSGAGGPRGTRTHNPRIKSPNSADPARPADTRLGPGPAGIH